MEARVSVDIGGTFTDLVLVSDGRVSAVTKVLTTPDDPSRAIEEGLRRLLKGGDPGAEFNTTTRVFKTVCGLGNPR